jgi:hypothetical protein
MGLLKGLFNGRGAFFLKRHEFYCGELFFYLPFKLT